MSARDPPQGSLWVRRQAWICLGLQLKKENLDLNASKRVYCDGLTISVIENMRAKLYGWEIARAPYCDANQRLSSLLYTLNANEMTW